MPMRLIVIALSVVLLAACGESPRPVDQRDDAPSISAVLAGEESAEGFARVTGPRPFAFPEDHGPHPAYRHEWWYITGNIESEEGRRFGYQITFFRFNVAPEMDERESDFATNQVWMAHIGITDPDGQRFVHGERFSRGGEVRLAGAEAEPFRVWLEDWTLTGDGEVSDIMPMRLRASHDDASIDLRLRAEKPKVLQGDAGYSRKGPNPGNASHYYSYTRLATKGELKLNGETHTVRGNSWMDREWGTSALSESQQGWDWFSLQLADGRDIMFYRLRDQAGGTDPHSRGVLVQPDGAYRLLELDEVELRPVRHWQSNHSEVRYPVAWELAIPGEELSLQIDPLQDDQELRSGFRYWEGAVDVTGQSRGSPVSGSGYLEMTGYGD